jgi:hypothetical protein
MGADETSRRPLIAIDRQLVVLAGGEYQRIRLDVPETDLVWQAVSAPDVVRDLCGVNTGEIGTLLVGLGHDGSLWSSTDTASHGGVPWHDWQPDQAPEDGAAVTGVAAWSRAERHFESAIVLDHSRVMHQWSIDDGDGSGWHEMEVPTSSVQRLVAVSGGQGRDSAFPELHLIGDGQLWSRAYSGDGWRDWVQDWKAGQSGLDQSPRDVSAWSGPDGRQHVLLTLDDGTLLQRLHGLHEPDVTWQALNGAGPWGDVVGAVGHDGSQALYQLGPEGRLMCRRWRSERIWENWVPFVPGAPFVMPWSGATGEGASDESQPTAGDTPAGSGAEASRPTDADGPPTQVMNPPTRPADTPPRRPRPARARDPETVILQQPHWRRIGPDDPKRIGKYDLVYIVPGGMRGSVSYVARDHASEVFLKTARRDDEPAIADMIIESGELSRALPDSPHLAPVVDVGEADGHAFAAQHLVIGQDLRALITQASKGTIDLRDALRYSLHVATAVQLFATSGLVHGDIKPANVIRNDTGAVCLIDYGATRRTGDENSLIVAFTPEYAAPEVKAYVPAVPASDIWSWAILTIELLTGKRVSLTMHEFTDDSLRSLAWQRGLDVGRIPKGVRKVLDQALSRDPDERPSPAQVVKAMTDELERVPFAVSFPEVSVDPAAAVGSIDVMRRQSLARLGARGVWRYRLFLPVFLVVGFVFGWAFFVWFTSLVMRGLS